MILGGAGTGGNRRTSPRAHAMPSCRSVSARAGSASAGPMAVTVSRARAMASSPCASNRHIDEGNAAPRRPADARRGRDRRPSRLGARPRGSARARRTLRAASLTSTQHNTADPFGAARLVLLRTRADRPRPCDPTTRPALLSASRPQVPAWASTLLDKDNSSPPKREARSDLHDHHRDTLAALAVGGAASRDQCEWCSPPRREATRADVLTESVGARRAGRRRAGPPAG